MPETPEDPRPRPGRTLHAAAAGLQHAGVHARPRLRRELVAREVGVVGRADEVVAERPRHVLVHVVVARVEDVPGRAPRVVREACGGPVRGGSARGPVPPPGSARDHPPPCHAGHGGSCPGRPSTAEPRRPPLTVDAQHPLTLVLWAGLELFDDVLAVFERHTRHLGQGRGVSPGRPSPFASVATAQPRLWSRLSTAGLGSAVCSPHGGLPGHPQRHVTRDSVAGGLGTLNGRPHPGPQARGHVATAAGARGEATSPSAPPPGSAGGRQRPGGPCGRCSSA